MNRSNRRSAFVPFAAAACGRAVLLVSVTLIAASFANAEDVKDGKAYEFNIAPKSQVRFTVEECKGGGGVWTGLWYEALSPNKDGKKIYTDIAKFCIVGGARKRTFGPYTIPQGPCKFSLNAAEGKLEIRVNVEVAEPNSDGSYGPFKTVLDVNATVHG